MDLCILPDGQCHLFVYHCGLSISTDQYSMSPLNIPKPSVFGCAVLRYVNVAVWWMTKSVLNINNEVKNVGGPHSVPPEHLLFEWH